jgi:hypothetical protein
MAPLVLDHRRSTRDATIDLGMAGAIPRRPNQAREHTRALAEIIS